MASYTDTMGRSQLAGAARTYYAEQIKNEQRGQAILHRFVRDERDPAQNRAHTVTYTRVYDVQSYIGGLTELTDTVPHAWLDSDTVNITTGEYGFSLRSTRMLDLETFWAGGLDPVLRDRIARHYVTSAERHALNAYLSAETAATAYRHYGPPGSSATSRATLAVTDIANADMVSDAMVALEGRDVSLAFSGTQGNGIYMLCHPFVLADIIREDESWVTAAYYQGASKITDGFKPPLWCGVTPVCSSMMRLSNAGAYNDATYGVQTTLNGAVNGASTAGGVKTIVVTSGTGLANGDTIAIHPVADGHEVLNTSTNIEWGEIASGGGTATLVLKRPLYLNHANGAYVTKSYDVFPVVFVGANFDGGETVVRGITLDTSIYPLAWEDAMSLSNPLPRFSVVSWWGVFGYSLISPWNMELYLLRTSQTAKANVPE